MGAQNIWIELNQSGNEWQALFACQICLQTLSELQKFKWGMNSALLLGEALDRQKLFIEAQHHGNPLQDAHPDGRTIALRCINIPDEGLLLVLLGKICAPTRELALQLAHEYAQELTSIFPLDYKIYPATTCDEFHRLSGQAIFAACKIPQSIQQILRFETSLRTKNGLIFVNGFWQNTERSDEQIWRILGNHPDQVMLNISLRPTLLENDERQLIWDMEHVTVPSDSISPAHPAQPFDKWAEPLLNRRLLPWKRFYLLQIHLLAPKNVSDSLVRAIGSAVTRESNDLLSPGFRAHLPANNASAAEWGRSLAKLEFVPAHINPSSVSRLSDIADLNEAHAVFRFPYPPEPGFPGVKFLNQPEQT
jgi:hypothetical protein